MQDKTITVNGIPLSNYLEQDDDPTDNCDPDVEAISNECGQKGAHYHKPRVRYGARLVKKPGEVKIMTREANIKNRGSNIQICLEKKEWKNALVACLLGANAPATYQSLVAEIARVGRNNQQEVPNEAAFRRIIGGIKRSKLGEHMVLGKISNKTTYWIKEELSTVDSYRLAAICPKQPYTKPAKPASKVSDPNEMGGKPKKGISISQKERPVNINVSGPVSLHFHISLGIK